MTAPLRINQNALLDPNVEFRLGNDSDGFNNPIFDNSFVSTPHGAIWITPATPKVGRYFTVLENSMSDIRVCDIWIIS